jgi:hypothetical protein
MRVGFKWTTRDPVEFIQQRLVQTSNLVEISIVGL